LAVGKTPPKNHSVGKHRRPNRLRDLIFRAETLAGVPCPRVGPKTAYFPTPKPVVAGIAAGAYFGHRRLLRGIAPPFSISIERVLLPGGIDRSWVGGAGSDGLL